MIHFDSESLTKQNVKGSFKRYFNVPFHTKNKTNRSYFVKKLAFRIFEGYFRTQCPA